LKTEYEKAVACEMFDAYCKQILRNALADYMRKKSYLNVHEFSMADMDTYMNTEYELNERSWVPPLFIEFERQSYPMENETLHIALSTLSERYIGVLLLKYWHRMNELEIAEHFHISERTVRWIGYTKLYRKDKVVVFS